MHRSPAIPASFLFCSLALLCLVAPAGFADWDAYAPGKLADVILENDDWIPAEVDEFLVATGYPIRAEVVFLGEIRGVSAARRAFLVHYFESVRGRPEWADLFRREVLCREADREFWLPIQEQVLPYFLDEVDPGSVVHLYASWPGALRADGALDWVFLVNEFESRPTGDGAALETAALN